MRSILFGIHFLILLGCHSNPEPKNLPDLKTIPRVHQIKVGGEGTIHLGEISQASIKTDPFISRVEQYLQEKRFRSIRSLVQQFPDVALLALRNRNSSNPNTLQILARFYDQLFLPQESLSDGWTALLQHRLQMPQNYLLFDQQRTVLLDMLQRGRFEEALQLPLDRPDSPSLFPAVEICYLRGISFLLANQNEHAEQLFQQGAEAIRDRDRYQTAHLLLLTSATQQRQEKISLAKQSWKKAVDAGSQAESAFSPTQDPFFWIRAIYLKLPESEWPTLAPNGPISAHSTAMVWKYIGYCHLKRSEGQASLLAFRTSQTLEKNPFILEQLQLPQSKALLLLKQESSATNILLKLAQNQDSKISSPALAMLGVLDLKRAETQRGLGLILRAIEQGQREEWDGRAKALSDLGLAYLMTGENQEGLKYLHEAQQIFKTTEQYGELLQSLENEIVYLEHIGESERAKQVKAQWIEIENV